MRRQQNIDQDPLRSSKFISANIYQNSQDNSQDFQIIDIDNDDNIDLGRHGKIQTSQISAQKKLEAARLARKNQKQGLLSSSIEQMDQGRDEQILEISPTKNNFHKFKKGSSNINNEFKEVYKEESITYKDKNQNRNNVRPYPKGQPNMSFKNYASEISSGQSPGSSAAKNTQPQSSRLNNYAGRPGPIKVINRFGQDDANKQFMENRNEQFLSSRSAVAYGNANSGQTSSRGSKSQIRTLFGKPQEMQRADQGSRAKSRGPQVQQPGMFANGFKNFGGAFMSFFKAQPQQEFEQDGDYEQRRKSKSRGRKNVDFNDQLNRNDTDYSASPQPITIKKRISSLVRGPNSGHSTRQLGSAKKTFKRIKLECTEEEIEYNWLQFKKELDEIYQNESKQKYASQQPYDLIDIYLKPKIDNIKQILLEEDLQTSSIGECMEYTIRNNMFMEMVALAQSDHPQGMFTICLDFIIVLAKKIKNMPLIHNDKVHRSLLQMAKCIHGYIKNDIIEVNDTEERSMYVRTILDFVEMITELTLDRDPEISKFFIEEQTQYSRTSGTQTYLPIQIILEFLKKESINQGNTYRLLLRNNLVNQLKINNQKVRRFIVLESDFAINLTSKLYMYLQIMPEEVQLIRNNFEQYPDDETQIYQSGLNLRRQIHQNYSRNIMDCFQALNDYIEVIDKMSDLASCSQVEYQRSKGDKKIVFQEQFCSTFFQQIMVEYFQPKLINDKNLDNVLVLRTTYQILLQILKQIQNKALGLQIFYFIFGKRQLSSLKDNLDNDDLNAQEMFSELKDDSNDNDFDKLREDNKNLDDGVVAEQDTGNNGQSARLQSKSQNLMEPVKNKDENGKVQKAPSAQMMSLQFAKLNFQAKNKLSSHALDYPYQQQPEDQEDEAIQIAQDRNDQIMQIFNQLPLDDDEFSFIMNSSRSRMSNHGYGMDSSRYLETNMTMLDMQLDEMDNQYNNKDQKKILGNFWNYINLNNTKAQDSFLEKTLQRQMLSPSFDLKKCRIEKMPAICMKILNTFLKYNIVEINESLLLTNNDDRQSKPTLIQNQMNYTERGSSIGGQIQESKFYQILKAQSQKLKSKSNFRHIQKLLTDLRDKLANQSNNGDSHLFSMVRDDKLDAIMVEQQTHIAKPNERASRNTIRIGEYLDSINFRKYLGNNISKGAQLYQELTMSEIVEELQTNGRGSSLYFLFKFNSHILKDFESLQIEKQQRYSILLKNDNKVSKIEDLAGNNMNFDRSRNYYDSQYNSIGANSNHIQKYFSFDKSLYNMTSQRYSLANPWNRRSESNDEDNCDIGSNSSDSSQNENLNTNRSINNTKRAGLINQDHNKQKRNSKSKKGAALRRGSTQKGNLDFEQAQVLQAGKHLHLEDLYTDFMHTILYKLDHYFDNPIDENVQLLQIVERILNYDLDTNIEMGLQRNKIYYVKKEVLLRMMNIIQKCETEFLGRVSLLNSSLQKSQARNQFIGRNALCNQPEIFRYVVECLIVQIQRLSLFNQNQRKDHRRVGTFYSNMDFLDTEVLENIIPLYDQVQKDFTNVQVTIQACKDLFINKKKQMNCISLLLAWSFGDIIFEDSDINKVKRVSSFGFNRSFGLSAMIDAQLLAHQMQSAYEEMTRQDQEFEATLDFYHMM